MKKYTWLRPWYVDVDVDEDVDVDVKAVSYGEHLSITINFDEFRVLAFEKIYQLFLIKSPVSISRLDLSEPPLQLCSLDYSQVDTIRYSTRKELFLIVKRT